MKAEGESRLIAFSALQYFSAQTRARGKVDAVINFITDLMVSQSDISVNQDSHLHDET